ncbi:MAG TPA: vitamin K epoxide reductase family protein [Candidatus Saccharimonadaceae bacterium]|nr:vitamin K epoxide reductase family protein [Candidatus Saccharimonadaceae bacterium]
MPKKVTMDRVAPITMIVGAGLGLIASFMLSNDDVTLASNSHAALNCSLNLVVNCATVAKSAQATVFGFPNSFIGLAALPVLITIGAVLLSGVKLPQWFQRAMAIGAFLGLIFAGWMFYESFAVIQVLCPWCMTTDLGMIIASYGVYRYVARSGAWFWCAERAKKLSESNYDLLVAIALVVLIIIAILAKFGSALFA